MGFNGDLYQESGATSVLSTKGDIVRYNTERERYGIGSTGQVLQVASSLPTWSTINLADSVLTTQGDVLYEGASALARLGQSTDNYTLATKGAGANPAWQASSTSVLTTTGDLLYASGANTLARLAGGTSGDVLTANGAGVAPSYQTAGGGGAWTELYNSGVMTSTGVLESGVFDDKKQIHFMVYCANYTSADNLAVRFNETRSGNTDGQYGWSAFYNVTASNSQSASRDAIQFLLAGSSGQFFVGCNGYIFNTEDNEKCVTMVSNEIVNTGGSNYPVDSYWTAKWANETDFVNEIQITNDGGTTNNQKVGSSLVIWGAD